MLSYVRKSLKLVKRALVHCEVTIARLTHSVSRFDLSVY